MARASAILVGALAGVFLLALPAMAQYPPAEGPTGTVSTTSLVAGGTLTVTGDGWLPESTVSLAIVFTGADLGGADLGTALVDDDGEFSTTVTIPSDTPAGTQTLRLSGTGADGAARTVDITVTVQEGGVQEGGAAAGDTATGGRLASTGGPVPFSLITAVGALLLVVGGGALYAARRLTKAGSTSQQ